MIQKIPTIKISPITPAVEEKALVMYWVLCCSLWRLNLCSISIGFRAIGLSAIISRKFCTSVLRDFCSNKLRIFAPGAEINWWFRDLEKISLLCLKMNSFVVSVHPGEINIFEGCLTLIRLLSSSFPHFREFTEVLIILCRHLWKLFFWWITRIAEFKLYNTSSKQGSQVSFNTVSTTGITCTMERTIRRFGFLIRLSSLHYDLLVLER